MSDIRFSVLMSVYIGEKPYYFDDSLKSILVEQTLVPSEVVIVLDGPISVELRDVLDHWVLLFPDKIVVLSIEKNVGLGAALNRGLKLCSSNLVFRMDSDDICARERFEKQYFFMQNNKDVDVCGAGIFEFSGNLDNVVSTRAVPSDHESILKFSKSRCPVNHPTVCYRKDKVLSVGGYPDHYPEDHLLWVKLLKAGCVFHNIQENLVYMRVGDGFIKRRGGWKLFAGELVLFRYMRDEKHITYIQYYVNMAIRVLVRLSPAWLRSWVYKMR